MIAMACAALEALGLSGQYKLKFSDRRLWDLRLDALGVPKERRLRVLRSIDKYDRLGEEGVIQLLGIGRRDESGDFTEGAGLEGGQIQAVVEMLGVSQLDVSSGVYRLQELLLPNDVSSSDELRALLKELHQIKNMLVAAGVSSNVILDTTTVRGLEYYTGPVFEAELLMEVKDEAGNLVRFGSVGGGGRYDDLVSRFKGQLIPATGFSIGVSRLAAALSLAQEAKETEGPIIVLPFEAEAMLECFAIAAEMREKLKRPVEVYLGGSGPKAQLKYADKRNAPVALILGGDERAAGEVTVKDLKLGLKHAGLAESDRDAWKKAQELIQQRVKRADLAQFVLGVLERKD
jgi:histidyl-tRNA synthetase